jgi:hypothetical protein
VLLDPASLVACVLAAISFAIRFLSQSAVADAFVGECLSYLWDCLSMRVLLLFLNPLVFHRLFAIRERVWIHLLSAWARLLCFDCIMLTV